MNEGQIISDENYSDATQEIIQDQTIDQATFEIISVDPENYNISDSFFSGVQVGGIMCLMSLGVAVVISILRKA